MDSEAVTDVKDEAPPPVEADNAAPSALATTPNLIEPIADEAAKPIEPVHPPVKPKLSDPMIGAMAAQRERRREAEEQLARVARENADLKAMLDRLSKGQNAPQDGFRPAQQSQPPMDEAAVNRMAEYKVFLRDVESLRARGIAAYGAGFTETIRTLSAIGADQDAFVHSVMAVGGDGGSHLLLHELAQDTDKAIALVNMRPEYRIAELTRMTMKAQAAPAATEAPKPAAVGRSVSKAPPPAPVVNSSTSKTVDWRDDKASDEEFTAGFRDMMQKRRGGRF